MSQFIDEEIRAEAITGAVLSGLEGLQKQLALANDRVERLVMRLDPVLRPAYDGGGEKEGPDAPQPVRSQVAAAISDLQRVARDLGARIDALTDRVDV